MGFNPFKSIGKAVKGITKPFKKILRSPIGKVAGLAALYYGAPAMFPNTFGGSSGGAGWKKFIMGAAGNEGYAAPGQGIFKPGVPSLLQRFKDMGTLGKAATIGGATMAAGAVGEPELLEKSETVIDDSGHRGYLNSRKGFVDEWTEWLIDQGHDEVTARAMAEKELFAKAEGGVVGLAQGGRIGMFTGAYGGKGEFGAGHGVGKGDSYGDSYGPEETRQGDAKERYISRVLSTKPKPKSYMFRGAPGVDMREKLNTFTRPTITPNIHQGGGGDGDQATWQRLGYPSYAAWLAAQQSQGGGGTGTGGAGDYYGFDEWADWAGGTTTPMFGDANTYKALLSQGGRIGLYAGGMGGMNNSMNPMMNQGLGATGAQGMNPYNQQNLMAQGQMRGQPQARPPMPGGPTTDQGPGLASLQSARVPQQNEDNELLQLIKMLASLGIPMEQLRGRTKEELVEMVISIKSRTQPEGREEVVEEQEEVLTAAGGGRVHAAGGLGETRGNPAVVGEVDDAREFMISNQGIEDVADYAGEYDRLKNPENYDEAGFLIEEEVQERAGGGLMRTGYAMGTEQPVIPSRDGSQLDFRGIGGYQPHGAKEKKDDVRALLAQGEFVVTSDAVTGIGEGDRDLGAKRMYDMMHKYEPIGRALS